MNSTFARVRQVISLVRLRPFDTHDAAGRSAERHRRLALTSLAALVSRILGMAVTFISLRMTVDYLGPERNGMWLTMSSMVAMLAFADLGLGSGVMNAVADASGRDDRDGARRFVSSAFFLLAGIACIIVILFAIIYPLISWPRIFNVTAPQAIQEAGPGFAVFLACFLINLPLAIIVRVQMAYQEGFISAITSIAGSALSLAGLYAVIKSNLSLPWMILALSGLPAAATFFSGLYLFGLQRPWLRPSFARIDRAAIGVVLKTGVLFLMLQIAGNLAFLSDNVVAAQVLGSSKVSDYSYPFRLFMLPTVIVTMTTGALWPVYAEAIARGDADWVRRTFYRSLRLAVVISLMAAAFLLAFSRPLLFLWVKNKVPSPSWMLCGGLAAWLVLFSISSTMSMLLNGLNIVKFQIVTAGLMAVVNLALSIILARRIGIAGLIWGTVISYTFFEFIPRLWYIPRLLRHISPQVVPAPVMTPSNLAMELDPRATEIP
jgi:O-antigen/teichoic acid export membrane protein